MQACRYSRRLRAVGCCEALGVHICLAVGGGVALLGHSKVDKHLQAAVVGHPGSRAAQAASLEIQHQP